MKKSWFFIGFFLVSAATCFGQSSTTSEQEAALRETNKANALAAQQAKTAVEGLMTVLREHNVETAYYAFTARQFQNTTSKDEFVKFVFDNPVFFQNMSMKLQAPIFQGPLIIFKAQMASLNNQKNTVEFAVIKEGESWKVFGIKVFAATP